MTRECACLAGGHAFADPGLRSRDASYPARTSTAANGGLSMAAGPFIDLSGDDNDQ
jgi:hypothetical protein